MPKDTGYDNDAEAYRQAAQQAARSAEEGGGMHRPSKAYPQRKVPKKEKLNDSQKLAVQQSKEQVTQQKMQDAAARHGGSYYTDRRPGKVKSSDKK